MNVTRFMRVHVLTFAVVSGKEHGTLPDDAPHWVGILDIAHEQLLVQEHSGGEVGHLLRTHEPRSPEPGVIATHDGKGGGEKKGQDIMY